MREILYLVERPLSGGLSAGPGIIRLSKVVILDQPIRLIRWGLSWIIRGPGIGAYLIGYLIVYLTAL